ncbi:MAG: hypothetical protein ACK5P3_19605 [Dolichospermum sp.]
MAVNGVSEESGYGGYYSYRGYGGYYREREETSKDNKSEEINRK